MLPVRSIIFISYISSVENIFSSLPVEIGYTFNDLSIKPKKLAYKIVADTTKNIYHQSGIFTYVLTGIPALF